MIDAYFAYGSNMNREQMSRRCPGAEFGSLAVLKGWTISLMETDMLEFKENRF